VSFHKLFVIFFDDRLLLGLWNWSDVKFLSLLNDYLVAITIPIPFCAGRTEPNARATGTLITAARF
jgi:hypothetical protein